MSDTKKFPAIGLLVVFGVGSAAAAVSLAGFGWLMVKQGLTQEAATPLATAAICLGSFLSGLLMAILQKGQRARLGCSGRSSLCRACFLFWVHCTRVSGKRCSSSGQGLSC